MISDINGGIHGHNGGGDIGNTIGNTSGNTRANRIGDICRGRSGNNRAASRCIIITEW